MAHPKFHMKAILQSHIGGADTLYIGETPKPLLTNDFEIIVKVHATALNRADILQREGKYPPPKGASPILGLEMAGEIVEIGAAVSNLKIGDRVAGILSGGGYSEFVKTRFDHVFKLPLNMSYTEAAAISEVFMTANHCLQSFGNMDTNTNILIHAGGSGVGTAAIQLAKYYNFHTIFTTASQPKHKTCLDLGADVAIDYKSENFEKIVLEKTNGKGVHRIIDFVAAAYFQQNLNCLARDGKMIMLAFLGGYKVPKINLIPIISKRLEISGVTIRNQNAVFKAKLTTDLEQLLPAFTNSELKPIIDTVFDWKEVQKAHRYMESNQNIGKIVLQIKG